MNSESQESGFDELMRLSRETARKGEEHTRREQERAEQRQKVQGVLQGLKEIKVSVALEQLKAMAVPDIIEVVSSLTQKPGTEDLRRLISDLLDDLERSVSRGQVSPAEMARIERTVKTMAILIDLFFSLQ